MNYYRLVLNIFMSCMLAISLHALNLTIKGPCIKDRLTLNVINEAVTWGEIKQRIASLTGIPPQAQQLWFNGRELQDQNSPAGNLEFSNTESAIIIQDTRQPMCIPPQQRQPRGRQPN